MRFNIDIPVENLTDEQLYAESRELKFLPAYFKRYRFNGVNKVPEKFTLGEGHILFFVYKPNYSLKRYCDVLNECRARNINAKDESYKWFEAYDGHWDLDHDENGERLYINQFEYYSSNYSTEGWEKNVVRDRIIDKITNSPKKNFHYHHYAISKDQAIELIKKS